jgi:phosphotransferase system  glucose/maltose/N-acetylglucosamine-specific IIC component
MINPLTFAWFWRGLKGHSITFAALFASVLLGVSIYGGLRHLLAALGLHWLYVIILPVIFFGWLSRMEPRWFPDQARRRMIARSVLFGAILLAALVAHFKPDKPAAEPEPAVEQTAPHR